jgi:hypothetical protein
MSSSDGGWRRRRPRSEDEDAIAIGIGVGGGGGADEDVFRFRASRDSSPPPALRAAAVYGAPAPVIGFRPAAPASRPRRQVAVAAAVAASQARAQRRAASSPAGSSVTSVGSVPPPFPDEAIEDGAMGISTRAPLQSERWLDEADRKGDSPRVPNGDDDQKRGWASAFTGEHDADGFNPKAPSDGLLPDGSYCWGCMKSAEPTTSSFKASFDAMVEKLGCVDLERLCRTLERCHFVVPRHLLIFYCHFRWYYNEIFLHTKQHWKPLQIHQHIMVRLVSLFSPPPPPRIDCAQTRKPAPCRLKPLQTPITES